MILNILLYLEENMKNQYQNEWKVEEKWDIFLENLDDSIDFDKELKIIFLRL